MGFHGTCMTSWGVPTVCQHEQSITCATDMCGPSSVEPGAAAGLQRRGDAPEGDAG